MRSTCLATKFLSRASFGKSTMITTSPLAIATNSFCLPIGHLNFRSISTNNTPRIGNKRQTKTEKAYEQLKINNNPTDKSIDEICASIDTRLTPEQQIYVDMLKKKISGGAKSQLIKCK